MSEVSTISATGIGPAMRPVQPKERIAVVDILRGFALLGVLMMNMPHFAGNYYAPEYADLTGLNRATWLFIRFFAQAKFYTIFSFLFGWGMAIQMLRARERGARFTWLTVRRLLILLLIGLVHAILIWHGDILNTYAMLGFLLLLFRHRSDKFLLVAATVCILIPVLISTPVAGEAFREWYGGLTDDLRAVVVDGYQTNVFGEGSYAENVVHRLASLRSDWAGCLYSITHVLGMFIMGLYVGRRRIFEDIPAHLPLFRRVMWVGLIIGLPLNALWVGASAGLIEVPPRYAMLAVRGARTMAGSALALAYISIIVLLTQRSAWLARLSVLAPLGRTALTNYLMQSAVFTLVFYGYGLGLYQELGPFMTLVLVLVFYGLQVRLSRWWMRRYLYGPMEWVWRSLTYRKLQPMLPEQRRRAREVLARHREDRHSEEERGEAGAEPPAGPVGRTR